MALACDCGYPKASVQKWENGSVLNVRHAVGQHDLTLEFVTALHSTEGTHTDGPHKNRPGWVAVLTTQVSYWYVPTPIVPLRCAPATRGEDSVLFRTFFFTPEGMPLLGPGIFVETGAADGLEQSTTLFFEKCLGWAGVLIEPHPLVWPRLLRAPRAHAIKRQAAICEHNGTTRIDARAWTAATTLNLDSNLPSLRVPCAPLWQLLSRVNAVRRTGRVDLLSLDVEGAEPIAVATLGDEISYGVVMAEVTAGARRVATMMTMLARGFAYVGQISARPSPTNYVISDVWYNRSHFERYWPRSRVLFV
jgi:FkbM family methyltransferase